MTFIPALKYEVASDALPVSVEINFCIAKVTSEPKSHRLVRGMTV
jgi:hypothetical protein